jgi:hypothetical protein
MSVPLTRVYHRLIYLTVKFEEIPVNAEIEPVNDFESPR